MVESNRGDKHSWKIHWLVQSRRWHLNHKYFLTDILTYSLSFFLTPFLTWVPAFDSLIMLWRFHSHKFKHAVLGRFKHSIQHSDWQNCSDSMWRISWHSISHFLWTFVWHFIWPFIWHISCKSGISLGIVWCMLVWTARRPALPP